MVRVHARACRRGGGSLISTGPEMVLAGAVVLGEIQRVARAKVAGARSIVGQDARHQEGDAWIHHLYGRRHMVREQLVPRAVGDAVNPT